jgi:uncharacterized protein involved in outer membrane biogenesis
MKKIWIALGGLIAALVIALLAVPSAIDWNTYRERIAGAASDALGREVMIGGDLGVQLLPTPSFTARNVSIANLKGATDPQMVNLRLIEVQIALGPLFGGNVQVETVRLIEPDIRLEVLADGRRNWEFTSADAAKPAPSPQAAGGAPTEPQGGGELPNVRLDDFTVQNGTVVYRDARSGAENRVENIDAHIAAASLSGPFEVEGRLRLQGIPLALEATLGAIIEGRTAPVSAVVRLPDAKAQVELAGTLLDLGTAPRFKGDIKAAGENLGWAAGLLSRADTMPGALGQPFQLNSTVRASAGGITTEKLSLSLGDTRATGSLDVKLGDAIQVAAKLDAGVINLDEWSARPAVVTPTPVQAQPAGSGEGGRTSVALAPAVKPAAPAATAGQKAAGLPPGMTGSAELTVDAITLMGSAVRQFRANAEIAGGEITLSQLAAQLPGATDVAAFGFISFPNGAPQFEGDVEAQVAELRRLLAWVGVELPPDVARDRLRQVKLKAHVRAVPAEVQITNVDATLDASRLRGGATIALRDRPAFGVDLQLDQLNVDSYLARGTPAGSAAASPNGATGAGAPAAAAGAKPAAANPLAGLKPLAGFDANFKVRIGKLTINDTAVQDVSADGVLFNDRLDLRQLRVADLAGANLDVNGAVSGFSGTPRFHDLKARVRADNLTRLFRLLAVEPPAPPARLGAADVSLALDGSVLTPAFSIDGDVAGGKLQAKGAASPLTLLTGLKLDVSLQHPDFTALLARLDSAYRPSGKVGALSAQATVTLDGSAVAVSGLNAKLGDTTATGDVNVAMGGQRPKITAKLQLGELFVDPLLPAARTAWAPIEGRIIPAAWRPGARPQVPDAIVLAAVAERWSKAPLDLSGLTAADADLSIKAKAVRYGPYRLTEADMQAALAGGQLTVSRLNGGLFGGTVNGTAQLNASTPANQMGVKLAIANMGVGPLLNAVAGKAAAEGVLALEADITTQGRSVADMVQALGGKASFTGQRLDVKGGQQGTALAGVFGVLTGINSLAGGLGGQTQRGGLADVAGSFAVDKGIARTQDLRIASELAKGQAAGTIDIAAWTLDLKGQVELAQNLLGALLAQKANVPQTLPLEIKGALDSPNVKLGGGGPAGLPVAVPGLDRLLDKKGGVGDVLRQIIPGAEAPQQQGTTPQQGQAQQQAPTQQQPAEQIRPEDVLKQLLRRR